MDSVQIALQLRVHPKPSLEVVQPKAPWSFAVSYWEVLLELFVPSVVVMIFPCNIRLKPRSLHKGSLRTREETHKAPEPMGFWYTGRPAYFFPDLSS